MKKDKIREGLTDFAEYVSIGIEEEGRERGLEVKSTTIVSVSKGKMPDSIFVIQQFCSEVARRKYSTNTYKVLFFLFSLSQYENFVSIDVKTIAENILINERSVMRATKQLEKDNILMKVKHGSDKRRIEYFINPLAAWRGKTINRTKALKKMENNNLQLDMFK